MEGRFNRLKEKPDNRPIIGWDSEDDSKGTALSFGFVYDDGEFYCRKRSDALEFVYSVPTPSIFIAHNLEYDANNLFKNDSWHFYESLKYTSSLIAARLKGRDHLFIDSGSFFNGTLARMGDMLGVPKITDNRQTRFSREYLMRDARIVYLFGKKMRDRIALDGLKMPVTIGQLSMKLYRSKFMHAPQVKTWNSSLALEAYYGGRTEIFYKGTVTDRVTVSDINSSYPNAMANELYPDTGTIEPSRLHSHKYGVGRFRVHVADNVFVPPLPYKSPGRRLWFPKGEFTGVWTYAEMRYAQSIGVKILREETGEGTNSAVRPFAAFVDHVYPQRQKYKRLLIDDPDNPEYRFESEFLKLVGNNLYGKFAQHLPITEVTTTPLTEEEEQKRGKLTKIEKRLGFYLYEFEREQPPTTANYLWGAYITSYARIHLHRGMQAVHDAGGLLLYCDTDSIMYSHLDRSPLDLDPSRLGAWDEEHYDLGHFEQSKGYLLCNRDGDKTAEGFQPYTIKKIACKGVPTRARYDFFLQGHAVFRKPIRLRESLVLLSAARNKGVEDNLLKELEANYWREVPKRMRGIYLKRSGDNGRTWPVDARDIDEIEENAKAQDHPGLSDHFSQHGIALIDNKGNKADHFQDEEIPAGWFLSFAPATTRFPRNKPYRFTQAEYEGLAVGEHWFTADVLGEADPVGYLLHVDTYMSKPAPKHFYAVLVPSLCHTLYGTGKIKAKKVAAYRTA